MNYLITRDSSSDYLAHYGVRGMKWGRRKQARQLTRILRKEQRSAARNIGAANAYQTFYDKYKTKYERSTLKGNTKRASRLKNKQIKYQNRRNDAIAKFTVSQKNIEKAKQSVNKHSDMMITYGRIGSGSLYGGVTANGGSLRIDYSKAKIRENNDKNKKRYADKRVDRGYRFVEEFWTTYPM